jgi:hypothetical protein
MSQKYEAGVCNIGKNEIRKRYAFGVSGVVVTGVLIFALKVLFAPGWTILFAFFPLALAFEGFYQGRFGFCAGFAAKGIFDLSGSGGKAGRVANAKAHAKDMAKAMKIHLYSLVSAAIVSAFLYLILR